MSVSSHLTPEPERRLWTIHDNLRRELEWADVKLVSLGALAAFELAAAGSLLPHGPLARVTLALLGAFLLLCVFALTPFLETPPRMPLADPDRGKPRQGDSLLAARDIGKYPQVELVNMMDRYLGGGVTATPYFDDIVGQIVLTARRINRKVRVLAAAGTLAVLAQLTLLAGLLWR